MKDAWERSRDLVASEVLCCLSGIAHELIGQDIEQALEEDWIPASRRVCECGEPVPHDAEEDTVVAAAPGGEEEYGWQCPTCDGIFALCELECEPVEVYEHWAVSSWLAGRLDAHGEHTFDLFGTTVWSRTTTGQAICADYVIQEITRELHGE